MDYSHICPERGVYQEQNFCRFTPRNLFSNRNLSKGHYSFVRDWSPELAYAEQSSTPATLTIVSEYLHIPDQVSDNMHSYMICKIIVKKDLFPFNLQFSVNSVDGN